MHHIKTADGTAIYAREWGTGPTIVLIHGWPLDADMWEYQAVPLAEQGFRVITYDRRGFGRSSQPWTGYDYDTLTDDLKMVMDTLKVEDATLVGFSMGGGEAARYMLRHAGKGVSKVAFVSAVTPYLLKTPDNPDGVDKSVFDQILEGLRTDRQHFLAGFGKKFFGVGMITSPVSTEVLDWTFQLAMRASRGPRSNAPRRSPSPISVPTSPPSRCRRWSSTATPTAPCRSPTAASAPPNWSRVRNYACIPVRRTACK